jgi:hypothetical protein
MEITADAGMPAMSGAHDTGDRPFALSNKGTYLLPVNIVMPREGIFARVLTGDEIKINDPIEITE